MYGMGGDTPWWMVFALLDEEERNRRQPEPEQKPLHTRWLALKARECRRFRRENKALVEKIEELNRIK